MAFVTGSSRRITTHHITVSSARAFHPPTPTTSIKSSSFRLQITTRRQFYKTTGNQSSESVKTGQRSSFHQSIILGAGCIGLLGFVGFSSQTQLDSPDSIFVVDDDKNKLLQTKIQDSIKPVADWKGKTHPPLDLRAASAKIKVEEKINELSESRGTDVTRFDTVRVASNCPVEDDYSYDTAAVGEGAPWRFWGVYDGHAGWATSTVLRLALTSYVVHQLQHVTHVSKKLSSTAIEHAVQSAFIHLDDEIVHDGLEALTNSHSHPEALSRIAPARAGSCALLSIFDPNKSVLHVACTGDSRAVLGRLQVNTSTQDSTSIPQWTTEALSVDQTGFNDGERQRINAEHPDEPKVLDIETGRTLGLAVTRAFGDHRGKWPLKELKEAEDGFFGSSPRPHYATPPYLTAEPVVTTTEISAGDFLIMASDGFWDHVSSEDAVECVGMWIKQAKKGFTTTKTNVTSSPSPTTFALQQKPTSPITTTSLSQFPMEFKSTPKDFTVEDDNVATHLARNALGGSRRELFCSVMSMQPPESRSVRDDITIQVMFFGDIP